MKRKTRASAYRDDRNVFNFNTYVEKQQQSKKVALIPKSLKQEEYIEHLTDWSKLIVFATGPAGTGKTMLAVLAGIKALKDKDIDKLIITRPAVGADDEKHGFLPGTLDEKMAPWVQPIFDVMQEYYSVRELTHLRDEKIIELSPLAFMRGRTFKDAWIIFDEAQNCSINQMKMVLTRLGENSKMIVTGDVNQTDRAFLAQNGLKDFISKLPAANSKTISVVDFGIRDVQRHPVVREILDLYGDT